MSGCSVCGSEQAYGLDICPACAEEARPPQVAPMGRVVNLAPHRVVIRSIGPLGISDRVIESNGLARVDSTPGRNLPVEECPDGIICETPPAWGDVIGLPEPSEGIAYIVSQMVAARVPHRKDVFSPGTGPKDGAVRDDKGQIVAVTRLIRAC